MMEHSINAKEIIVALRKLRVETGSLACLGCGLEHHCGASCGCRIMREAADLLENYQTQIFALQQELEWKRAQLDCANTAAGILKRRNEDLQTAAATVTRLTAEAAVERDWIRVEDRLPEQNGSYIVRLDDTDKPKNERIWGENTIVVADYSAGSWTYLQFDEYNVDGIVTHWMPLPKLPEGTPPC